MRDDQQDRSAKSCFHYRSTRYTIVRYVSSLNSFSLVVYREFLRIVRASLEVHAREDRLIVAHDTSNCLERRYIYIYVHRPSTRDIVVTNLTVFGVKRVQTRLRRRESLDFVSLVAFSLNIYIYMIVVTLFKCVASSS